ncbi:hypothetical protein DH2020_041007 [Rehmannia glutinosa]|uniref:Pentatricopeptide repeat-containing protein n=1 Tax=Rehmannia glutinosa TaxID=99300 RepID=A0ABR0US43_REHGL
MELSLIGLQNAGKTSLVNVVAVGFNMRKVTKGNVTIKLWDLGGQPRFRSMWERYCRAVSAIVYVVDAADHDNISISKSELHDLLSKPSLSGIPLLVLGNKIDKPQALSKQALTDQMWHPKDQRICKVGPGRTCLNPGYDPDSQPHVEGKFDVIQMGNIQLHYDLDIQPQESYTISAKRSSKIQPSSGQTDLQASPPLTDTQQQAILEESHFQTIKSEYKKFTKSTRNEENEKLVGKPWERLERLKLRELASGNTEYDGERLDPEHLRELSDIIECERDKFTWLLDNDIELEEGLIENDGKRWAPPKRSETEAIKIFINRLSATEVSVKDWKFVRMMRYSGLQFTEGQMLKIVEGLGDKGHWRHALSVVEWVYNSKEHKYFKSRFVYTKLLKVLGRARKPREALKGDAHIYPDMAAYHCLAVTLGQAGFIKELLNVIESMKEKPKKIRNMRRKNWNPELQPDIIIFNSVLNACVQTCQWKGVSWVFQQMRKNGLRPNGASYGLAMEFLTHLLFACLVLVRAFWEEGKVNDAVQTVRDMERRGVIGTASVYYELARCLCFHGRWEDAILEIEKLKNFVNKIFGGDLHWHDKIFHGWRAYVYTFSSMLEASASALQWEYFEYIYKEMTLSGYQVDQRKHSALLVEASRAGKWHLLEHAFDSILEAGEIPPVSFFTEMACQAIIQHDYERAVNIVNTMAHAPFQVSFQEWIIFFERNRDRIDKATLNELQEKLVIRDLVNEATVINFSKALHFMCESCEDSLNSIFDKNPKDSIPANTIGSNLDWNLDIREGNLVNSGDDKDLEVSGLSNNRREGNVRGCHTRFAELFDYDLVSKSSPYDSDDVEFEHIEDEEGHSDDDDDFNFELIIPSSEVDDLHESDTPSAYEILETWKKK